MVGSKMELPRHIAIVMDGNGRWANRRGLSRIEGHRKGADAVRDVVRAARELGVKALTLYAFSSQNWDRPLEEVHCLMTLLRDYLLNERDEILQNHIRLTTLGDTERLPDWVKAPLDELKQASAHNDKMVLCLAISYGGRESIAEAARTLCLSVLSGERSLEQIDTDTLTGTLSTRDLPPLDLLVRTSGEQRLSNFLLWEAAYAELYFTDTLWPDFTRADLLEAIAVYAGRERRFGLTSEQARLRATQ